MLGLVPTIEINSMFITDIESRGIHEKVIIEYLNKVETRIPDEFKYKDEHKGFTFDNDRNFNESKVPKKKEWKKIKEDKATTKVQEEIPTRCICYLREKILQPLKPITLMSIVFRIITRRIYPTKINLYRNAKDERHKSLPLGRKARRQESTVMLATVVQIHHLKLMSSTYG